MRKIAKKWQISKTSATFSHFSYYISQIQTSIAHFKVLYQLGQLFWDFIVSIWIIISTYLIHLNLSKNCEISLNRIHTKAGDPYPRYSYTELLSQCARRYAINTLMWVIYFYKISYILCLYCWVSKVWSSDYFGGKWMVFFFLTRKDWFWQIFDCLMFRFFLG